MHDLLCRELCFEQLQYQEYFSMSVIRKAALEGWEILKTPKRNDVMEGDEPTRSLAYYCLK
jgi:hypothetical protein